MSQRNDFRQILVHSQRAGDRARDRCHFNGVRQAGAQVIPRAVQEHLCFVFKTAERARVHHPRTIALKASAVRVQAFVVLPASRLARQLGVRCKKLPFGRFQLIPGSEHREIVAVASSINGALSTRTSIT